MAGKPRADRAADRAGPAGDLAPAPAAALAGGAARQRLGARPPATGSSSSTPGSAARDGLRQLDLALGPGRLRGRGHRAGRLHPLPHRPLRAGRADHRGDRLRALDPPAPGSTSGCMVDDPRRRSSSGSRSPARAASRPPALERYREAREGRPRPGSTGSASPTASSSPGSRWRPTTAPGRSTRPPATPPRTSSSTSPRAS